VVNNDQVITPTFGYPSAAWAEVTGLVSSGQLRHGAGPRGKVLIKVTAP
jgi:hypothetical protein